MRLGTLTKGAENAVNRVSRVLNIAAPIGVGVLMLLITGDVIGRSFFDHPIPGTLYISQYVLVSAVYCGLAYCAVLKGHVKIDLLVSRFSERARAVIGAVTGLISLVVFSLLVWSATLMTLSSWSGGEVSLDKLRLPAWPFRAVLVIGVVMLCLVLLIEIIHRIAKAVRK